MPKDGFILSQNKIRPALLLIWGFTLLLLLLTWCGIGYKIYAEKQLEIQQINRTNLNLARALEEHTLRTIKSVDQAVLFLKFRYQQQGKNVDIVRFVREGMILNTLFNQLGVIDEHGQYIVSNLVPHHVINLADRPHFKIHQTADCGCLYISRPVLGRASGKWSIQMTRRINKPDGSFGGVVVVSLDPYYFVNLYDSLDLGHDAVVNLIGNDGIGRVRRAGGKVSFGESLKGSPVMAGLKNQEQGSFHLQSRIDGIERFFAFRRVQDYPLTVIVGMSDNDALGDFYQRMHAYLWFGGLVSLTLLLFAMTTSRLMRRLVVASAQAEESSRLKSEFLASVSHELRTPLNGIIGYAELIELESDPGDARADYADIVKKSGNHLLLLVNSILDMAKIDAGSMQLDLQPLDLAALSRDIIFSYQTMAGDKGLKLYITLGEGPFTLQGDATRLTQVLNNLLHNALKFTDQGEVELSLTRNHHVLRVAVRDTGPGIAVEDQQLIFEKFRQAAVFESRQHQGAGLGLALSHQLIALMGGELKVSSVAGGGSTFYFTLPLPDKTNENNGLEPS
jgi:two-component system sensor histidine kinase BarA